MIDFRRNIMKKFILVLLAMFVTIGLVFSQEVTVEKQKLSASDKLTVKFFFDDGTETGKELPSKGFTFYLLKVIGDKPSGGQVSIFSESLSSIPVQKDGLYILGARSEDYGWLSEGNFGLKFLLLRDINTLLRDRNL